MNSEHMAVGPIYNKKFPSKDFAPAPLAFFSRFVFHSNFALPLRQFITSSLRTVADSVPVAPRPAV
jgi:hypothetical protein